MGSVHNLLDNPEFERRVLKRYGRFGGNGSGGDDMWQQSVESRLTELGTRLENLRSDMRSDFRLTWALTIGGILGLAGLMAKGFGWL